VADDCLLCQPQGQPHGPSTLSVIITELMQAEFDPLALTQGRNRRKIRITDRQIDRSDRSVPFSSIHLDHLKAPLQAPRLFPPQSLSGAMCAPELQPHPFAPGIRLARKHLLAGPGQPRPGQERLEMHLPWRIFSLPAVRSTHHGALAVRHQQ
jgi:hypothetical protein